MRRIETRGIRFLCVRKNSFYSLDLTIANPPGRREPPGYLATPLRFQDLCDLHSIYRTISEVGASSAAARMLAHGSAIRVGCRRQRAPHGFGRKVRLGSLVVAGNPSSRCLNECKA